MNNLRFTEDFFQSFSNEDLTQAFDAITKVRNYRKEERKKELIRDFTEAFNALKEAGYGIAIETDSAYYSISSIREFSFD